MPQRQQLRVRLLELAVSTCPNGQMAQALALSLVAPVQIPDAAPRQRLQGTLLEHNVLLVRIPYTSSMAPSASAHCCSTEQQELLLLRSPSNPWYRTQKLRRVPVSIALVLHAEISWLLEQRRQRHRHFLSVKAAMAFRQKSWHTRPAAPPATVVTTWRARERRN